MTQFLQWCNSHSGYCLCSHFRIKIFEALKQRGQKTRDFEFSYLAFKSQLCPSDQTGWMKKFKYTFFPRKLFKWDQEWEEIMSNIWKIWTQTQTKYMQPVVWLPISQISSLYTRVLGGELGSKDLGPVTSELVLCVCCWCKNTHAHYPDYKRRWVWARK